MTIKELEKYCIDESTKCMKKASMTDGEESANYKGKAQAFMWIAATIQNEVKTKNVLTKEKVDNLFSIMKDKGISTSYLCKEANIEYTDFVAMCKGKHPCYKKWKKRIADVLEADSKDLF